MINPRDTNWAWIWGFQAAKILLYPTESSEEKFFGVFKGSAVLSPAARWGQGRQGTCPAHQRPQFALLKLPQAEPKPAGQQLKELLLQQPKTNRDIYN